ncbi:MAG: FAD-binding protein [Alphaproteobacteria bacterium]|nr:FAD-binding protein [Rhodospirillales bacterium]MCW9045360.1 FAD-binding protein [Alphaproteobacteria bacterium]
MDSQLKAIIEQIVGVEHVSDSEAMRELHGHGESYHKGIPPELVVFAGSTEEVSAVVKVCSERNTPIIPYGTGTSLEDHVSAYRGGVSIDVSRMDKVIKVNTEDLDVVVQPGVTRKQLDSYLRDTGLFFPVDPGADASLGGMAATRASGTNAVRYGTMRENVISMTVVLADGTVIKTASRSRKSAAGYDLTRLMVGSEGTLGVITELTLRLYGVPEAISAAVCPFDTIEGAVDTVISTIQCGIPVARIELLDAATIDAVNKYSKLDNKVTPTLFFEFHGSENGVEEQTQLVKELATDNGAGEFQWATLQEDRDKLWHARHNAYYASMAMKPGTKGITGDTCVPISRLAEAIDEANKILATSDLLTFIVGHVGDGNFHTVILVDPDNEAEIEEAKILNNKIVERALELEGTCTGEHGVGRGKMDFLIQEHGAGVEVMKAIKKALDPNDIMNPGKIVTV